MAVDEFGNEIIVEPSTNPTPQTDPNAQPGAEKTFTQEELDKIVSREKAKVKARYADYDNLKADVDKYRHDSMTLRELSEVLNVADVPGTPTEQVNTLRQAYGLTKIEAEQVVNASNQKADDTAAFVEATKFARKASDDDVIDEVERILETPSHKRTAVDNEKIEALKDRYGAIKYKSEYGEAKKWFEDNGEGNFTELLESDDFKDFAEGSTLPLKRLVEKFYNYSGKKKQPSNPGSVKDTGGVAEKDYYTPAEVDKLTPQQLENPKIWDAVRKSMTKWK